MSEKIIYENDNYKIFTGPAVFPIYEEIFPTVYKLVNKKTGVLEAEELILAAAIAKATHYHNELVRIEKEAGVPPKTAEIKLIN